MDIGLRYMLLGSASTDIEHIFENVVYLELIRRGISEITDPPQLYTENSG